MLYVSNQYIVKGITYLLCMGKWKRTVIRHWYILGYLASFLDLALT